MVPSQAFVLIVVMTSVSQAFRFDDDPADEPAAAGEMQMDISEKVRHGAQSYEMLKSEVHVYGTCWSNAMDALHMGCKQLDDERHARLALMFANCFLDKMGAMTILCPADHRMQTCTADLDDRQFQAYTQFFIHTQSTCFFLANQMWQSRAEQTIGRMTSASYEVAERLQRLQSLQQKSIDTQTMLNQELGSSKTALQEFEKTLRHKQSIEQEILIRFLEMRDFILNELSKFYAIGFYSGSIVLFYLMTTPVRTKEARLWTFIILAFNVVLERFIVSHVLSDKSTLIRELGIISSDIDEQVWICRKACLIVAVIVLLYFATSYKDYAVINNLLLTDIMRQNEEIRRLHEISISQRSELADFSAVMKSYLSSDESDSEDEVSETEKSELQKDTLTPPPSLTPSLPPQTPAAITQTLEVDPNLKAIVAVESGSQHYNLRTRSPAKYSDSGSQSSARRAAASVRNKKVRTNESTARNVFSSDEDL